MVADIYAEEDEQPPSVLILFTQQKRAGVRKKALLSFVIRPVHRLITIERLAVVIRTSYISTECIEHCVFDFH